ncbi:ABC transporter ATP-binding protein [Anabaena azotica]|uniref:ABC transporter ATP-binding protein n=1 Tax=Anabaena azotica FACHB-119 TaxID=947527 RepID=A0ABR8D4F5_9NOST|nr:ABC transporter ATP-binding protein [Anabaena azotica]MBD2501127.1 ABC transporter ATP-binding protein [Anabaena azotica FACHB-119]
MSPLYLSLFQAFKRSVLMLFQAAPKELRNITLLTLASSAFPPLVLLFNKIIINEISNLLARGAAANPIALIFQKPLLLWTIGGVVLLNLFSDSINTIVSFIFTSLRDRVQGFVQGRVFHKVANYENIALFENPELLNIVQLAEKGVQKLEQLSFIMITTLNGIFILIPSILLSWSITWWIPLILLASLIPAIYVELKYRKQCWEVENTQASINREMNLYKDVLMGDSYAKELRLFHLQNLLLERWQSLFKRMFIKMEQVRQKGTAIVFFWSTFSGAGVALPFVYIVIEVLRGVYTLGDLALYTGLILQLRQSLYLLISSGSDLYNTVLSTTPIFQLLDLQPQFIKNNKFNLNTLKKTVNKNLMGIHIKNVSFSYLGNNKQIIDNINLTIQPNEMIALVGENGAGKTTLAKLLCCLYYPTSGEILWNGRDLRSLDLNEIYSRITVVMQDYARFPTTLRENVGFGYLPSLHDDTAIRDAINQAGMAKEVEYLAQGLETLLGKQLETGVDLSGGQWQRIAIARALMRISSSELLIFDEPTAALDPKTEHEIYNIFRNIASNRIAIVVSHRLALARLADRIVVMEKGRIIEVGTHDELMGLGGQYSLMFNRQASSYQ